MEFHFRHALLPNDGVLLDDLDRAACRLYEKLICLNPDALDISEVNKKCLDAASGTMRSALRRYAYMLAWSIGERNVPYEEFVFVDYGGGAGVLSLLAKELGVGTVVYVDNYEPTCKDAKVIGQAVQGDEANHYVLGGIDELLEFLNTNSICCNAVASSNVIEHIYDIEAFFKELCALPGDSNIVMTTDINPFNPSIKRRFTEFQRTAEYGGRVKKAECREDFCTRAYIEVRSEIISNHARSLSDSEVERLATATRGLIEPDIKKVVDEYLKTGEIFREPEHPTNTVNPYTGNWAERFLDFELLCRILSENGFDAKVLGGYYGGKTGNITKKATGVLLNMFVRTFKRMGLFAAPFVTIYATRRVS